MYQTNRKKIDSVTNEKIGFKFIAPESSSSLPSCLAPARLPPGPDVLPPILPPLFEDRLKRENDNFFLFKK